jgi:hypothetical protein
MEHVTDDSLAPNRRVVFTNAIFHATGKAFATLMVLHAKSLPGNPYDGHTLRDVIEDTQRSARSLLNHQRMGTGSRSFDPFHPGRI